MISFLKGEVVENNISGIVLEINGIGYEVFIPSLDSQELKLNQETKIYIYEDIKEDSHNLYGFLKPYSKELFKLLISVKNIGPKAALSILNTYSAKKISSAIHQGDIALLTSVKGIGPKAARQVIVELKDKFGLDDGINLDTSLFNDNDEALQGLIALGYSKQDALKRLAQIDKSLSSEQRIKKALQSNDD